MPKLKFEVIDNCPVPTRIAPQVRLLKHDVPHAVLQSGYRGEQARGLLRRLGKSTQAMLYNGFIRHLPGFNPANRPGQSTHELFSDGHAYRGPVGRILFAWQCGLDWNDDAVDDLIEAAKHRGWELFRPYSAGSERHHTNFRRFPKLVKKVRKPKARVLRDISAKGIDMIVAFEGCRLKPYQDSVGVWTIGYGHTRGVTSRTRPISAAKAKLYLHQDLEVYEEAVTRYVKVPLSQEQFDALVSLTYNIGIGAFAASTLLKRLNAKHYGMAANQFLVWYHTPGSEAGLLRRRKAERQLFLAGSNRRTRAGAATGVR